MASNLCRLSFSVSSQSTGWCDCIYYTSLQKCQLVSKRTLYGRLKYHTGLVQVEVQRTSISRS